MIGEFCNDVLFRWRSWLPPLRAKPYSEVNASPILQDLIPKPIASQMQERSLKQALFYAWILHDIPWSRTGSSGRFLDLGSKDFVYAASLATFVEPHYREFKVTGLELDPYRIYTNLYRRGDAARYYAGLSADYFGSRAVIDYQQGNWLNWKVPLKTGDRYDLITSFFPFLYLDLHSRFGLPKMAYSPRDYFFKCYQWARRVLFFHQGKKEADESLEIIKKLGLGEVVFRKSYFENPWMVRKHPTEVILWEGKT